MKLSDILFPLAAAYLVCVTGISVILTVWDKRQARLSRRRVSEKALLLWGLAGGALPMYLTMKSIRHKTLHKKFMIGLPLEFTLHFLLAAGALWLVYR